MGSFHLHQLEPPAARNPSWGRDFTRHWFQPHVLVSAPSPALGQRPETEKSMGEALHRGSSPSCMAGLGTGMGSGRVAPSAAGWQGYSIPIPSRAGSISKVWLCRGGARALGQGFPPGNEICVHLNGLAFPFTPVSPVVASTATARLLRPGGTMSPQHHREAPSCCHSSAYPQLPDASSTWFGGSRGGRREAKGGERRRGPP